MKKCFITNCNNPVESNKKYCSIHGYRGKCQIEGCNRIATKNYSLCSYHYKYKNIFPPDKMTRFMQKLSKKENGCWEWNAYKSKQGYGIFNDGSGSVHAHSFIYAITYNKIPKRLGHKCKNRSCVNPEHLFEYKAENRAQKGKAKNGGRKLKRNKVGCEFKAYVLPLGEGATHSHGTPRE